MERFDHCVRQHLQNSYNWHTENYKQHGVRITEIILKCSCESTMNKWNSAIFCILLLYLEKLKSSNLYFILGMFVCVGRMSRTELNSRTECEEK